MPFRILSRQGGRFYNLNRIENFETYEEADQRIEDLMPWEDEAGEEGDFAENEGTEDEPAITNPGGHTTTQVEVLDEGDHVLFVGSPEEADAYIESLEVHEIDNIPKNNIPNGQVSFEDEPFMPYRPHPDDDDFQGGTGPPSMSFHNTNTPVHANG